MAVGILGKILGCYTASRIMHINRRDSLIIGIGMIARGEVCLIVMQKGISAGLMEANYLVMGVMLVIVSSILAPILLRVLYRGSKSDELPPPSEKEEQLQMQLPVEHTQNLI